jgi:hypothetical protein
VSWKVIDGSRDGRRKPGANRLLIDRFKRKAWRHGLGKRRLLDKFIYLFNIGK